MSRFILGALALITVISGVALNTANAEETTSSAPLTIEAPYAFATAQSQKNGAAFGTITNNTDSDIAILDAHSDVANRTEIHEMAMNDGIMKMRKLEKLMVPASGTSALEVGGNHIMFMGLKEPLKAGTEIEISLEMEDGSQMDVVIPVVAPGQKPDTGDTQHEHHNHDHHGHQH